MNWSYAHIAALRPEKHSGYPAQQSIQHSFVWRGEEGVIDTMSWEGFREGIDDVRYYTTLLDALVHAETAQPDSALVRQTRQWLNELHVDTDLDIMRLEMVQRIEALY